MANTVVRARIDEHVQEEAAAALATIGLTVSDACRLMMVRIAKDKALPFEPLVPDAETIEAMREARRGGLPRYPNVDAMLKALNEGDCADTTIPARLQAYTSVSCPRNRAKAGIQTWPHVRRSGFPLSRE
jgi:DNA-damage-inducible protein J